MMLKFREDKIQRMESLVGGLMPADSYLLKENSALSEEIQLLQAKVDRNPEVTRFALENIRFQDLYQEGEREMLLEEISELRNQLAHCHRLGNQDAAETIAKLQAEIGEMRSIKPAQKGVKAGSLVSVNKSVSANLKDEITRLRSQGSTIANLEEQLENVQKSIDKLVMSLPSNNNLHQQSETTPKTENQSKILPLAYSNMQSFIRSPCSPLSSSHQVVESDIENRAPPVNSNTVHSENQMVSEKESPCNSEECGDVSSKKGTPYRRSSWVNMKKMQKMFQNAAEENVRSIRAYVTELKERVAKLQYQKQLLVWQVVLELEAYEEAGHNIEEKDENTSEIQQSPAWHITFREQIIESFRKFWSKERF